MTRSRKRDAFYRPAAEMFEWHERAACRGADPEEVWFYLPSAKPRSEPAQFPQIAHALEICEGCPVRELCRAQAAADPWAEGVWGGEYWPPDWQKRRGMVRSWGG